MNVNRFVVIIGIALLMVIAACGDETAVEPTPASSEVVTITETPTSTPAPIPTSTPTPEVTPAPEMAPSPTSAPGVYDSKSALYDVFPGFTARGSDTRRALDDIQRNNDASMIPALIEIVRFMPPGDTRSKVAETLQFLTGQTFGPNNWDEWMYWMGENLDEIEPPDGYADWKASLYSEIDELFAYFLRPARDFSRIHLAEVVWGGVRPDGIPDLRNPTFFEPGEADYLQPGDRVFGLEINGDARAYPLRIVNAHEMVNDIVGGEPVSLMW